MDTYSQTQAYTGTHWCRYTQTHTQAYKQTYISDTYMTNRGHRHTYIHRYIDTDMHKCRHTQKHKHRDVHTHTCIHTNADIQRHVHRHRQIYNINTHMQTCTYADTDTHTAYTYSEYIHHTQDTHTGTQRDIYRHKHRHTYKEIHTYTHTCNA
jgi:hypothetical protein